MLLRVVTENRGINGPSPSLDDPGDAFEFMEPAFSNFPSACDPWSGPPEEADNIHWHSQHNNLPNNLINPTVNPNGTNTNCGSDTNGESRVVPTYRQGGAN